MLLFLSSPHRPTAILSIFSKTLTRIGPLSSSSTMSISFKPHAFAGNPIRSQTPKSDGSLSPSSAYEFLKNQLLHQTGFLKSPSFKILPFKKGRPLTTSTGEDDAVPNWHLGWINLDDCKGFLAKGGIEMSEDLLVYLGSRSEEDEVYWAIDVSEQSGLDSEWSERQLCFVELRTLIGPICWLWVNWLLLVMLEHY